MNMIWQKHYRHYSWNR